MSKKILVIEDDTLTINALQHSLSTLGHEIYVAASGEDALRMLLYFQMDLIITDIMMPGMSGLSLIGLLRSVHHCTTPIIIMSTLNHKPLLDSALKAGADDFISKPFVQADLEEKLNKFNKALTFPVTGNHLLKG